MKKIQIHKVIFTIILYGIGFTMLTPLLWMISTSFKPENEVFQFPIRWIPEHSVGFDNYKEVWGEQYNFGMYYLNSIKVTVISTVLQILVSALGAYGFTKIKWKVVPDLSGNHDDPAAGYDRQPFCDHAENGTLQHSHGNYFNDHVQSVWCIPSQTGHDGNSRFPL